MAIYIHYFGLCEYICRKNFWKSYREYAFIILVNIRPGLSLFTLPPAMHKSSSLSQHGVTSKLYIFANLLGKKLWFLNVNLIRFSFYAQSLFFDHFKNNHSFSVNSLFISFFPFLYVLLILLICESFLYIYEISPYDTNSKHLFQKCHLSLNCICSSVECLCIYKF